MPSPPKGTNLYWECLRFRYWLKPRKPVYLVFHGLHLADFEHLKELCPSWRCLGCRRLIIRTWLKRVAMLFFPCPGCRDQMEEDLETLRAFFCGEGDNRDREPTREEVNAVLDRAEERRKAKESAS